MGHQNSVRLRRTGVTTAVVFFVVASAAAAKPLVSLNLPAQADAGAKIHFSYSASRVPHGATVVIQRQMGTARRFRTIARVQPSATGAGELSPLKMGRHVLRIAVLDKVTRRGKKRTVVLAAQTRRLFVFDTVPFNTLFPGSQGNSYNTGSRTFTYVLITNAGSSGGNLISVQAAENTCRSVHVDWVVGPFVGGDDDPGTISVVQESRDPSSAAAPINTISAVDAALTPGESWALQATAPTVERFYANGTASCYSSASLLG